MQSSGFTTRERVVTKIRKEMQKPERERHQAGEKKCGEGTCREAREQKHHAQEAELTDQQTRAVNIGVFSEAAHMLVEAAQPANIDTVVVDGRILKRGGKLVAMDAGRVTSEANAALVKLRQRAGWW